MQLCTTVCGKTAVIASGKTFRPSMAALWTVYGSSHKISDSPAWIGLENFR